MLKWLLVFLLSNGLLLGGGLYIFKHLTVDVADGAAERAYLRYARRDSQQETAENVAKMLYADFGKNGYSEQSKSIAAKRPYLTNRHLPDILRVPHGVLELTMMEGWCDDAARALIYILAKAEQWNMQGPHAAHAAVRVHFDDGTSALLDPFYGYTSIIDGKPHDPIAVRATMQKGKNSAGLLKPFNEKSNKQFYTEFGTYFMGAQGEPLTIMAQIPRIDQPLTLGTLDGNSRDVYGALTQNDMTITWEYAGHKYDRGWTRELVAKAPVQVQIILTRKPNDGILRTFTPAPAVDGTKLTWNLLKGEKIISEDAKAAISLTRLKSYIGVDQIVITPEGATP